MVSDEAMSVDEVIKEEGRGKSSSKERNLSAVLNVL